MMLYIALTNGYRIGEVFGQSWEDNETKGIAQVNRGYDYNYEHTFTDGKNKWSLRKILATEEYYYMISQYKLKYQKDFNTYLFLDKFENPYISYNGINKHLKKVCKKLKIQQLPPHSLRHTHCSILIFQGLSVHYISKRLGHKNVVETLKTYSHLFDEFEQQQNEKALTALKSLEA